MRDEDDGYDTPRPALCGCGRPARGDVLDPVAGQHFCRQCSEEHCELARYVAGAERRRGVPNDVADGVAQLLGRQVVRDS